MYIEGEMPDDPKAIVYAQVRRVLDSRSMGQGAAEAMAGLMALIEPWKDKAYYEDLRAQSERLKNGGSEGMQQDFFWGNFEVIVRLLARHHLWPMPPKVAQPGEELLEAL